MGRKLLGKRGKISIPGDSKAGGPRTSVGDTPLGGGGNQWAASWWTGGRKSALGYFISSRMPFFFLSTSRNT